MVVASMRRGKLGTPESTPGLNPGDTHHGGWGTSAAGPLKAPAPVARGHAHLIYLLPSMRCGKLGFVGITAGVNIIIDSIIYKIKRLF